MKEYKFKIKRLTLSERITHVVYKADNKTMALALASNDAAKQNKKNTIACTIIDDKDVEHKLSDIGYGFDKRQKVTLKQKLYIYNIMKRNPMITDNLFMKQYGISRTLCSQIRNGKAGLFLPPIKKY